MLTSFCLTLRDMNNKKLKLFISILLLSLCIFSVDVFSKEEYSEYEEQYKNFVDTLPDSLKDKLPDSVINGNISDTEDIYEGLHEMSGVKFIFSEFINAALSGALECLPLFISLCGLLIIASLIKLISDGLCDGNNAFLSVISKICIYSCVIGGMMEILLTCKEYFEQLCLISSAYIPLAGTLFAIGGNVKSAVSSTFAFGITLNICQFIFTYTVFPVFAFLMCINISSAFDVSDSLISLGNTVKKNYTFILSLIMAILTVSITSQTFISAKADGLSVRGLKFVIANFIPLFGGGVASTLSNVAASIELMRSIVGIGGIIMILLLLIPSILKIAIIRMLYTLCGTFAAVLGCNKEKDMLYEISSLYGYLLSVSCICTSVFLIMFGLLSGCACAFG